MSASFIIRSEAEMRRLGMLLAPLMRPGEVIFLEGDLGAGKSVLARGIAAGLGVEGPMPSPTFTLMQPYEGNMPVYHFDLYRLDGPDEMYEAGLDEYLFGNGVSLVEWPLNALEETDATGRVRIRVLDDGSRNMEIDLPGRQAGLEAIE